jgi:hypothetical protein
MTLYPVRILKWKLTFLGKFDPEGWALSCRSSKRRKEEFPQALGL